MIKDSYGQLVYNEDDLCNIIMRNDDFDRMHDIMVDSSVGIEQLALHVEHLPSMIKYQALDVSLQDFDRTLQERWHMPQEYYELDICQYVLDLCTSQPELQRVGEELLLYQERDLFNLLRYLKYLVDTMKENNLIWGVGRGSSVASFVLYKLGVHKINSLYYNLDIREFLR